MDVSGSCIHNFQNLEASKMALVGEWVNKLWYIQTMEYYSVLKRDELPSNEKTYRNLKYILLSIRNQNEKAAYYRIPTI